ncbi:hypothetical protein, partial [Frisingicoccus sp.]|uniref:hypothetical protein n=1 Tax=Frisingicoccus sp. TaxID=1918627 RepID=UPI002A800A0D
EQIQNAIYSDACSYDPPADLKQRIDAQIAQQKKEVIFMKKMSVKKVAVVAAALCALTATVCMAGGKIAGYVGGTRPGSQTSDFSDIGKMENKLDVTVNAPEDFDNGYAFSDAHIADFDALDESNVKVKDESELNVTYEKNGKRLNYSVKKGATVLSDAELERAEMMEQEGVTYYYLVDQYLFLPPNEEPTAEELAAQDAGSLNISYGSDERQEQNYYSLWWIKDGQTYTLAGFDVDLSAQEMVEMAAQIK